MLHRCWAYPLGVLMAVLPPVATCHTLFFPTSATLNTISITGGWTTFVVAIGSSRITLSGGALKACGLAITPVAP